MAGHKKITVDELFIEIQRDLGLYCDEVQESVDLAADWAADELVSILKSTSPEGKTKKYKKGWKKKKLKYSSVVYNKNKPGLTHLLEHGHAKRGGGRVAGRPHIKPAEDAIMPIFEGMVINIIEGGTRIKRR